MRGAIQYVRLENLPRGAIGPGLLGNGGAYYFQAGGTFSYQFYLRALSAAFVVRRPRRHGSRRAGCRVTSTEMPSAADPTDGPGPARLDGRLLGDMEWLALSTRVGRRARRGPTRRLAVGGPPAVLPTQGTFEESANLTLDRLRVVTAGCRRWRPVPWADQTRFAGSATSTRHPRRAGAARQQRRDGPDRRRDASPPRRRRPSARTRDRLAPGTWWCGRRPGRRLVRPVASRRCGARPRAASSGRRARPAVAARRHRVRLRAMAMAATSATGRSSRCCPRAIASSRSNTYALMNVVDAWTELRRDAASTLGADRGRPPRVRWRPVPTGGIGQRRHRAHRQLLRLPGPQHARRRHAGVGGRGRTCRGSHAVVDGFAASSPDFAGSDAVSGDLRRRPTGDGGDRVDDPLLSGNRG